MLLRLAYLSVTNVFALMRLLPMSNQDKDAEILALRHRPPNSVLGGAGGQEPRDGPGGCPAAGHGS